MASRQDSEIGAWTSASAVIAAMVAVGMFLAAVSSLNAVYERRDGAAQSNLKCVGKCPTSEALAALRGAAAAEDMVDIAVWQLALSGFGMVIVGLTLGATALAAREANRNANAAQEAVRVAERTASMQLRPYIFMQGGRTIHVTSPEQPDVVQAWWIQVSWKNVGLTPARRVESNVNWGFFPEEGPPKDFEFPANAEFNGKIGAAGPGHQWASIATVPMNELSQATDRGEFVHFWGWTEYDGFPDAPRHRTEVHGRIVFLGNNPSMPGAQNQALILERFNGVDETCLRKPSE